MLDIFCDYWSLFVIAGVRGFAGFFWGASIGSFGAGAGWGGEGCLLFSRKNTEP